MKLKIAFYWLCACLHFITCDAQTTTINCDASNYSVYRRYKGDIFKVECDTIYVLNKSTFNLMYNAYNDFRNQNLLLAQYTLMNDSISNMYEAQLDSQKLYFDTLNTYFNQLSNSADQLVKKSSANVDSIARNLDSVEFQVRETKKNIANAQTEINLAKKQMNRKKLQWGAVGFGLGIVATTIAALLLSH